jgi:hypothetical protein
VMNATFPSNKPIVLLQCALVAYLS